jgi:hypothetical protein
MSSSAALYFLHIQKTAGTTVRHLLESRYAPEEICPAYQPRALFNRPPQAFAHYRLFRGHLGYVPMLRLHRPFTVITFMRNPIDVVVSMYYHMRNHPKAAVGEVVTRENLDLDGFLHHDLCRSWVTNPQTYQLTYLDQYWTMDRVASFTVNSPNEWVLARQHEGVQEFCARPSEEMATLAMKRLDEMSFVGIYERLNDSLTKMCDTLSWPRFDAIPRMNPSPDRITTKQLSASTRREIERLTEVDQTVYAHACQLFEERILRSDC